MFVSSSLNASVSILVGFAIVAGDAVRPSRSDAAPPPATKPSSPKRTSGHQVGVGWPSLTYDWWNRGQPDWAIGAELVYGDWSGAHSDVEVGFAANGRFRWRLSDPGQTQLSLQISPGILFAVTEGSDDRFVFGIRSEVAVPVAIRVHPRIEILTGGVAPMTVLFVEDADPSFVLPLLGRIGVRVAATSKIEPWLSFELGPGIRFSDDGADAEFAFRVWTGVTFW